MKQLLPTICAIAIASSSFAADPEPWPAAAKAEAIAGCRLSITENAERDYLTPHNLTDLPQNFRESMAPAIEPFLASCDCLFGELEKRWTFDEFLARQSELPPIVNEIMTGVCAVDTSPPEAPDAERE
jgi:hypothetical protein